MFVGLAVPSVGATYGRAANSTTLVSFVLIVILKNYK